MASKIEDAVATSQPLDGDKVVALKEASVGADAPRPCAPIVFELSRFSVLLSS